MKRATTTSLTKQPGGEEGGAFSAAQKSCTYIFIKSKLKFALLLQISKQKSLLKYFARYFFYLNKTKYCA
jgi:hypothetical protein